MPLYEVEQYEIWASKYRVRADSEAEAIAAMFRGEGDLIDNSLEFLEPAEDYGITDTQRPDLVEAVFNLTGSCCDGMIPSIRSIEEVA